MRLRHRAPTNATVTRRHLSATCVPHPRHGPQPLSVEIHAPGAVGDDVAGTRWTLPGLTAEVATDASVSDITVDGDRLTVRYEPVGGQASWRLTVDTLGPAG